jgi:hypothetical protein
MNPVLGVVLKNRGVSFQVLRNSSSRSAGTRNTLMMVIAMFSPTLLG